jgi:putative ABC transport system permease protein
MQSSLLIGFEALRANPLRTLLSTLGVVMGVGAMVSVLSMGDGVEQYAREQIERTTDLLQIAVTPTTATMVDGIYARRDDIIQFTIADADAVAQSFPTAVNVGLGTASPTTVTLAPGTPARGFMVRGLLARYATDHKLVVEDGRWFSDADTAVVVLSKRAAGALLGALTGDSTRTADALAREISLQGAPHRVIGVLAESETDPGLTAYIPVTDAARAIGPRVAPQITLSAARIEDVDSLRAGVERWAASRFGESWKDRITVASRRLRVEQTATAMRVFKLLMAAITGVSLLVGGVGIMNVLLASVAERTREIGIRKATGARNRDILVQFLAESVAITGFGAAIGVALGLGIAFLAAAVMRAQTDAPVHAAVTLTTVGFAVGVSVLIGLVFGLYPARRAARLSPIDAIRHD